MKAGPLSTCPREGRSEDAKKAADLRDRLWTLVVNGYEALWNACAYLYGPNDLDKHVPALQAHVATTSKRIKANAAKKAAKLAAEAKKPVATTPAQPDATTTPK